MGATATGGRERLAGHRLVATRPDDARTRAIVAGLLGARLDERRDLVGVHGPRPGSGRSDSEFWQRDPWFLKSRAAWILAAPAAAIATMVRLHELRRRLLELVPAGSLLAVLEDPGGRFQLWSVAPRLVTLRERLDEAAATGDWRGFTLPLLAYAHGLGLTMRLALEEALTLDPNPSNFAAQGGRVRYIDDDVIERADALGIEDAFIARFTEYRRAPEAAWQAYIGRFVDEVIWCAGYPGFAGDLRERLGHAARLRPGTERWVAETLRRLAPGEEAR